MINETNFVKIVEKNYDFFNIDYTNNGKALIKNQLLQRQG